MLQLEPSWRFGSPGAISRGGANALGELVTRVCAQASRWQLLELFKSRFAQAAGAPYHSSSSASWAESDLALLMSQAEANAPLFIEAVYAGCVQALNVFPDIAVPDVELINRVLAEHDAGYRLEPPHLHAIRTHLPIAVPERPPSLDEQAHRIIQSSLELSERFLSEGRARAAVQEILWLLETVSTAFRDDGSQDATVQGRYFNKIIGEMKGRNRGSAQHQILTWMMTLHGYLSSPTGGGIRHGQDLESGVALRPNEARLYCDLIRSYIAYLIAEHEAAATVRGGSDPALGASGH